MNVCKDCRWWNDQHECVRNGRETIMVNDGVHPPYPNWYYPLANADDPACSHFKPREESPGTITLEHSYSGECVIESYYDNNRALREWAVKNIQEGEHRVFRLEPVEDER